MTFELRPDLGQTALRRTWIGVVPPDRVTHEQHCAERLPPYADDASMLKQVECDCVNCAPWTAPNLNEFDDLIATGHEAAQTSKREYLEASWLRRRMGVAAEDIAVIADVDLRAQILAITDVYLACAKIQALIHGAKDAGFFGPLALARLEHFLRHAPDERSADVRRFGHGRRDKGPTGDLFADFGVKLPPTPSSPRRGRRR